MIQNVLNELFERDLAKLKDEISQYSNEEDLWKTGSEVKNSAGNLALHIVGNLQHFIGGVLGGTGYVRKRESEFSDKNIPRTEIINSVDKTISVIKSSLSKISDGDMKKDYPVEVLKGKSKMKTEFFLVHLLSHLNYHLGQINYHRRLIK